MSRVFEVDVTFQVTLDDKADEEIAWDIVHDALSRNMAEIDCLSFSQLEDCVTEVTEDVLGVQCTPESGHLPGSDHRWQECPTYHDDKA